MKYLKRWITFLWCILMWVSPAILAQELSGAKETCMVMDGNSIEKAIVIKYIGEYNKSINQEYQHIAAKFGTRGKDYEIMGQKLLQYNNKFYDEITVKLLTSRQERKLYFDISEPFAQLRRQLR
ncbi:MAG: hypothetical protein WCI77_10730 [Candidatus Omnitrophota bacterium]